MYTIFSSHCVIQETEKCLNYSFNVLQRKTLKECNNQNIQNDSIG